MVDYNVFGEEINDNSKEENMSNYALTILENALRDEIIAKTDATNYLLSTHAYDEKIGSEATRKAFEESGRLADERIPQLQSAIKSITSCGADWDTALTDAITTTSGRISPYDKIKNLLKEKYNILHKS